MSRDQFITALRMEGVPAEVGHYDPVYRRPTFVDNDIDYTNQGCPKAEWVADREAISLSHRLFLGPAEWMDRLVEIVSRLQEASELLRAL